MHILARHAGTLALPLILSAPLMADTGPEHAEATVPPVHYRSAFDHHHPFLRAELADWREVNDTVRQLGGHMGHMPMTPASPDAQQAHDHGGAR